MARRSKKTTEAGSLARGGRKPAAQLTSKQIAELSTTYLANFAERLKKASSEMENNSIANVPVGHFASAMRGIDWLCQFVASVEGAVETEKLRTCRARLGLDPKKPVRA